MNDLLCVVDWSRAQFALTAMMHWIFVPLTIGLSLIVSVMESVYYKTREDSMKKITQFWMTLFAINFACGVATGIILEFEFGTNWSNYSWFVGDIFGAPLAIEGIFAFFLESTFFAVMMFGWNKVGPKFHLAATWLTAIGVCISALWILIANAWMQNPVGMEFDPEQARNVMSNFSEVALSPTATNKFLHTVLSGWVLGSVFVIGVSCFLLLRKSNEKATSTSIKIASIIGLIGIILTIWTGDGSAVQVSKVQPMKLAAMEGLYRGEAGGQSLVGFGILNPSKTIENDEPAMIYSIDIPNGLSILAKHDSKAFVPGINDIIDGIELTENGDTIKNLSYAERIKSGKKAHEALRRYNAAVEAKDFDATEQAAADLEANFKNFGYGYFDNPAQAVPNVPFTFYSFRIMVIGGGYLLLFFIISLAGVFKFKGLFKNKFVLLSGILTIPVVWIVSEAGWVVAEVGRQPWAVQDLLPVRAAVSSVSAASVETTFWIFVVLFSGLFIAEVSIMLREIFKASKEDITNR